MNCTKYHCALDALMDVIGGKYKPVILYHLMSGTKRFGQLQKLMPEVSQRMLTQHLRELEHDNLIHREIYKEVPPRVEYSLTPLGTNLSPLLRQMHDWAEEHIMQSTPA